MQYKNPLHKLYELFAFHLSSSFFSSRISLYLEERLAWRTIHGVSRLLFSLFLPRKSIENRGSWLDDRFLAKVEPRQGRIRKGRFAKFSFPCRGALSPMKLRRPSLPTSTRHGLASCLPRETPLSALVDPPTMENAPATDDKTWRWITAFPTPPLPPRNLLYAFQFYYAETSRGRNFGAEFISFSITSLADNLIGGAATHVPPSPSARSLIRILCRGRP